MIASKGLPDQETYVNMLLPSPACPVGMFASMACRSVFQTDILHASCTVEKKNSRDYL